MDMHNTGRVTIVEFSMMVQDLSARLEVQQLRELWSQLIGDEDHSAKHLRSVDFAGRHGGYRRVSMGSGTTTAFRAGIVGPGSHIDSLIGRFLSCDSRAASLDDDAKAQLLFRRVFDTCDRASKAKEATGFVDARVAALIIHSAVHEIDFI